MKTIQQKSIDLFWSLDRDQLCVFGHYCVLNYSSGFVVLNHEKNTFEIFSTIEKAMDSVPEEDLLSNPYIDDEEES